MAETVVYREEQINRDTGEIIVERKVVKEKISNRDQFVRVFSQNGDAFKNLTLGEYKILLELLSGDYINYSNEIILSPAI
ncbi:hypothetical protein CFT13S00388_10010, partial [Campylobacter fetus subsp. testudinum]|uniref:hypothetical protein n=1 Tax=Campylobacter fetus TaxID=196 RepID=UPI000827506F